MKMKKRMKMVDMLASVALVGVISATVLGQVGGGDPTPVTHTCPGFTTYRFDGQLITIKDWECPEGQDCLQITIYDSMNRVIGAAGGCIIPQ